MSDPLVTVETFGSSAEAEIAKNFLQVEGIAAYVSGGETADMLWHIGGALGGVKLQVPENDLMRARRVLASRMDALPASDADDYGLDHPRASAGTPITPAELEDEDRPEPEKDVLAHRAWRAAIIGLFLCPPLLNLYSLWTLLQLSGVEGPMSDAGRRSVVAALVVNAVAVCLGGLFWLGVGLGPLFRLHL